MPVALLLVCSRAASYLYYRCLYRFILLHCYLLLIRSNRIIFGLVLLPWRLDRCLYYDIITELYFVVYRFRQISVIIEYHSISLLYWLLSQSTTNRSNTNVKTA